MSNGSPIELERAEFFSVLGPERLARVQPLLQERRFKRQRVLFFEGEAAAFLWTVRRGEVRLYKASRSGRITTLETLLPGEIFGAISALDDESYPASAEAVSEGSAWCLPREAFLDLLAQDSRLAVEILHVVSRRLTQAHERLRSFAHDPVPARLARALLDTARAGEARVTRRGLAEAAGTTVETAIRVLRRFEKDGVVRGAVGHVDVVDESALRRIAGDRSR